MVDTELAGCSLKGLLPEMLAKTHLNPILQVQKLLIYHSVSLTFPYIVVLPQICHMFVQDGLRPAKVTYRTTVNYISSLICAILDKTSETECPSVRTSVRRSHNVL